MEIRKAKVSDVEGIYKVFLDFDSACTSYISPEFRCLRRKKKPAKENTIKALTREIRKRKSLFIIAIDKDEIVGYAYAIQSGSHPVFTIPNVGELADLAVSKKHRGKGIASLLWKEVQKWFKLQKCKVWQLQVIADNPARNIYEKWGFKDSVVKMRRKP